MLNDLFDQDLKMNREDGILSRNTDCNHAMVICGVDLSSNQPVKWKVENSWGEKASHDGYYIMDDNWFDKYVVEVIIDSEFVDDELKNNYNKKPIMVKKWQSFVG